MKKSILNNIIREEVRAALGHKDVDYKAPSGGVVAEGAYESATRNELAMYISLLSIALRNEAAAGNTVMVDFLTKDIEEVKAALKAKGSINEVSGFASGKQFIDIKLERYPRTIARISKLIAMIGESKFTMEMAEWVYDFFNNASFERPISESDERPIAERVKK